MTKQHATKNFINRNFTNVYSVSFCNLESLLKDTYDPAFYNAGYCGWNWDGYIVNHDTVIVTGYRNFTGQHIDHDTCGKYNAMAREIKQNFSYNWDETQEKLKALMNQMLAELKEA
jgi:hypothetical protein